MGKHLLTTGTAILLALAAPAGAETTLTVANWLPPSHPLVSEVIVPMTEKIAEATHGEVRRRSCPPPSGRPARISTLR